MTLPSLAGTTIGDARRTLASLFTRSGCDAPDADARILIGHALGLDHAGIVSAQDRILTTEEANAVMALAARRAAREPVARILGAREFWGMRFRLSSATLVPRPETETLIEAALSFLGSRKTKPLRIADLGTGSGAILLALLSELPNAFGIGTDIDSLALITARDNARRLGYENRTLFVGCDFGAALAGGFDLVLSNPPYIASGEIDALAPEVRAHDPRRALDGGRDGLAAYRKIAADAPRLLAPAGALILELGSGQAAAVAQVLAAEGLVTELPHPDLAGVSRALTAHAAMP